MCPDSTHIRTSESRYFLKLLEISQYEELCRVLVYYGTPSDARHPFLFMDPPPKTETNPESKEKEYDWFGQS